MSALVRRPGQQTAVAESAVARSVAQGTHQPQRPLGVAGEQFCQAQATSGNPRIGSSNSLDDNKRAQRASRPSRAYLAHLTAPVPRHQLDGLEHLGSFQLNNTASLTLLPPGTPPLSKTPPNHEHAPNHPHAREPQSSPSRTALGHQSPRPQRAPAPLRTSGRPI